MEKHNKKTCFYNIFQKIFLGIFFVVILFFVNIWFINPVNASQQTLTETNNWTSSDFRITLSEYDPISRTQAKWQEGQTETQVKSKDWKSIISTLLERLSNLMLMIIPILGAISLIIAGYFYIFSFADEENTTKAKTIIKYNLLAIVVAFGSWVIISTIAWFFK